MAIERSGIGSKELQEAYNFKMASENRDKLPPQDLSEEALKYGAQFLSILKRLESLHKLNGDPHSIVNAGTQAMRYGVQYFSEASNKDLAFQQIKNQLVTHFDKSTFPAYEYLSGALGEYQIEEVITKSIDSIGIPFEYSHATGDVDAMGIDSFIVPPDDFPEYRNKRTGLTMQLALSIKTAPLPPEINDVLYPVRTISDFDAAIATIEDNYNYWAKDNRMPKNVLEDNMEKIRHQLNYGFRRLHGQRWNNESASWEYVTSDELPLLQPENFIPVVALASSQNYAPIGNYRNNRHFDESLYDAVEYQLTDNPGQWSRSVYSSDGIINPNLLYAA